MDHLPRFEWCFGEAADEFQRYLPDYSSELLQSFANVISMSPAEYTGFWRSTSYGSAYACTLAEPTRYWSDLESCFAAAAKGAMISVDFGSMLVLAHCA